MNKQQLIISSLLSTALLAASCGGGGDKGKQAGMMPQGPALVGVTTVSAGNAAYYESYPATVTALNEVELRPQVSGYITGIHFQDGQQVQKGQLLYSIDQQTYQASVNQAQANIAVAKANLARAQKDADRYTELDKKDAIAKQVLDHAMADLDAAKMQVKAAEAGATATQTNLRYSNIYAPFSGTIGISLVKLGAAVSPGTTLLNTVSTDDPIAADFFLDQKDLPAFETLKAKENKTSDTLFSLALADGSVYPFTGSLASMDRAVDPNTGTLKVRLSFANAKRLLKPGMSATVRVHHKDGEDAIIIPYKAVTEQMGEYFVYAVTDSSTVTQTKVKLGAVLQDRVVVKEGLTSGQRIVSEGLQRVREGAKITTDSTAFKAQQQQQQPKK
jgi:membrane fusion protein (multidrug efflux system)